MTQWKVELHSHTFYSKDCLVRFEDILRACDARGVDKIAITDHNTAEGALRFQQMAPARVIVGEEIFTTQGELLAYFVKETVPHGLTPQHTINILRDQGAIISVSHPFDPYRKGAWHEPDLRAIIDQVDAIETFNARCLSLAPNDKAAAYAQRYNKPGTVGSDAHSYREYGQTTLLMNPFDTASEFLDALRTAVPKPQLSPFFVHFSSTFAKYSRKLRLIPRAPKMPAQASAPPSE
jgi:predicted metal-dependent phosphoesterase TrpH